MNRFKNRVKGIAKKSIIVRMIMMLYCVVYFSLRNLGRYIFLDKKKAIACVLMIALAIPRPFVVNASMQEDGIGSSVSDSQISGNDSAGQVTGGDSSDDVSGGDGSSDVPGGDSSDDVSGGDSSSDVSGGDSSDDVSGGDGAGDVSGGDSSGDVSGGDGSSDVPGGDSSDDVSGGDSSDDVSGGDAEQNPEGPNEPGGDLSDQAVRVQQIEMIFDKMYPVGECWVGNSLSEFLIRPVMPEDAGGQCANPVVGLYYGYDGQEYYAECTEEGISVTIPHEYFGFFYCYGVDEQGNPSNRIDVQIMMDTLEPAIFWEEMEINEIRYMRITVQETGCALSGIDLTKCFIYGISIENIEFVDEEIEENFLGQAVLSKMVLDVSLEDLEEATIEFSVSDYAGNLSTEVIEWSEETKGDSNQILSMEIPCSIPFVISTWRPDQQINSEQLTIVNNSECDVFFKFANVNIAINKDNISDKPGLKDCDIYMEMQEGEQYYLPEGDSGVVDIVRIPGKNSEDEDNTFTFSIGGYIHPDSDEYWRDGDITISIVMSFWGIPEDETEE